MFWAAKANKQTILNGVDPVEVLASVPDARCKAWRLKLSGKTVIDPTTLVEDTEIGPQMASDVMNLKLQEIFELVEEELVGKTKEQINVIKMHWKHMQRASVSAQACGRGSGQHGESNGTGQPTDSDQSHQRYDEANRGHKNTRSRRNDGKGTKESGCDQTGETESWQAETNR